MGKDEEMENVAVSSMSIQVSWYEKEFLDMYSRS